MNEEDGPPSRRCFDDVKSSPYSNKVRNLFQKNFSSFKMIKSGAEIVTIFLVSNPYVPLDDTRPLCDTVWTKFSQAMMRSSDSADVF